ncbi:hypothetical protein LY76DRAFT_410798 [Colletotrichum caudatum]|nr:hypothetical protein LY76DRAFT_410798 [Colletotrichum caudatum]
MTHDNTRGTIQCTALLRQIPLSTTITIADHHVRQSRQSQPLRWYKASSIIAKSPATCYRAHMIHACLLSKRIPPRRLSRLLGLSRQQTTQRTPSTGLPSLEFGTWSYGHFNIDTICLDGATTDLFQLLCLLLGVVQATYPTIHARSTPPSPH